METLAQGRRLVAPTSAAPGGRAGAMTPDRNPWAKLSHITLCLAWESAAVVMLRSVQIAQDRACPAELGRMVAEKVGAALELQALALAGRVSPNPLLAAQHGLTQARRRVRANRRRLLR